jgi:hypothetical protein
MVQQVFAARKKNVDAWFEQRLKGKRLPSVPDAVLET